MAWQEHGRLPGSQPTIQLRFEILHRQTVSQISADRTPVADRLCRVGLIKVRLIMAKLHFNFDVEAVDKKLDWVKNSQFRLLWDKPALDVYLKERNVV